MPVACTFDRLVMSAFGSSGAADSFTETLMKNGVTTPLTCTVVSGTGALSTCSSFTTVSVVRGDLVGLKVDQVSGVPIVRLGIGTRCN